MIGFEYDINNSTLNEAKHGIDFCVAQLLWLDSNLIEVRAKSEGEPRFLIIGKISDKHRSGIITYREKKVRIISVRRSRAAEVELYES